jgi:hypothetical protein
MPFALPPVPIALVAYDGSAQKCRSADIAVTSLTVKLTKHKTGDHYVITSNLQNVGGHTQQPNIVQRVELLRGGIVLVPQTLPPLDAGVTYPVSFALDRPVAERGNPLVLTVRYVAGAATSAVNNCSGANDSLTKTF